MADPENSENPVNPEKPEAGSTEPEVTEPAAKAAVAAEDSTPAKPTNELKVVIIIKDKRLMVGVQSPDCDPVYKVCDGTLAVALKMVPALVKEAKLKWESNPLYKKAVLPTPPAPPPRTVPAATRNTPRPDRPSLF